MVEDISRTCSYYLSTRRGGGFPRAQGRDLPQHGAPGKTVIVGFLDHGEGEGGGAPARGYMLQDSPACLGHPPPEAPLGTPTDSAKSGGLWSQSTGNGAGGNYGHNGGNSVVTTAGVRSASRVGLDQPATITAVVWGGKSSTKADFRGVRVLDVQQSPTLGGLQGTDVGAAHWP